jgi:hypothetical protein
VDTFPFLAVLLCAMGSLILVLMAMDLRARKAALARGREQAQKLRDEQDRAAGERESTLVAKKLAIQKDWERKRDALLARVHAEETALADELRQVQARLFEAAGRMEDEQGNLSKLLQRLQKEQGMLVVQRQALAAARKVAAGVTAKAASTDQARATLVDQLVRLEQALKTLKEDRERDSQTYSVIPYLGKHGESRRPMYIECATSGFVFHPDKLQLGAGTSPSRLRSEIQGRAATQITRMRAEGVKDTRPYIMLLVRPDGIQRYYQAQSVLRDLSLEFGYEFVDADWILKVPVDGPPSTSQLVTAPAGSPPPPVRGAPGFLGPRTGSGGSSGGGPIRGGAVAGGSSYGGSNRTGVPGSMASGGSGVPGFGGPPGTARPGGSIGRPGSGSSGVFGGQGTPGNGSTGSGWPGSRGSVAGGGANAGIPVIGSEGPGLGSPVISNPASPGWGGRPGGLGVSAGGSSAFAGASGSAALGQPGTRVGIGQPGLYGGSMGSSGTLAGGTGGTGSGQPGAQAGIGVPSVGSAGSGSSASSGGSPVLNPLSVPGNSAGGYASSGGTGSPNPLGMQSGSSGGGSGSGSPGGTPTPGQSGAAANGAGPGGGPIVMGDPRTTGQPAGTTSPIGPDPRSTPLAFVSSGQGVERIAPPSDNLPPSTPPRPPDSENPPPPRTVAIADGGVAGGPSGSSSSGPPGAPRIGSGDPENSSLPPSRIVDVPQIAPDAPPLPRRRPAALRPASVCSNGDYVIFIECRSEYLVIYPSQKRVAIDALNHSKFHNPLYRAIEQMIARRLSTLRPGEKEPRIQVRFLVHPDADRTLHLAYPVLESLPGEKVRYNLQPEDDVARIISAY